MSCGLPQNTVGLSLSEAARVAISRVCLDPRFAHAAREIGAVLGSRLESPFPPGPLSAASICLQEAYRTAAFVRCEIVHRARDEAQIRLHDGKIQHMELAHPRSEEVSR